jgi:hypothetical protein
MPPGERYVRKLRTQASKRSKRLAVLRQFELQCACYGLTMELFALALEIMTRRKLSTWLWMAGTLVLWGWCAPSQARAECGDYVMVNHQSSTDGHRTSQTAPVRPAPQVPSDPRKCQRPACVPQQAPPPAPVQAPVKPAEELWFHRFVEIEVSNQHSSWLFLDQLSALIPGHPGEIFHPPR